MLENEFLTFNALIYIDITMILYVRKVRKPLFESLSLIYVFGFMSPPTWPSNLLTPKNIFIR